MANKYQENGEEPKKETRSIFHDDDNLQDEQAEFDANNPPENMNAAINNLMAILGQKTNDAEESAPFTIVIGSDYHGAADQSAITKAWFSDFAGKTISTTSPEAYLELAEAEVDCVILLTILDRYLESPEADKEQFSKLEKKAEEAMLSLRELISKHCR
jgi:hypothetical protein